MTQTDVTPEGAPVIRADPFSPEHLANPHPLHEQLREAGPVVRLEHCLAIEQINNAFVRGPIELVPGVQREEGIRILQLMGKAATQPTPKGAER
jgi:hypothetical protein